MAGAIFLGVLAGLMVLSTIFWTVRHCQDGAGSAKGGGGVSSATGQREALLNKNKDDDVVIVVPRQPGGGGHQLGGPEPEEPSDGDGDVELCAICKARLADASWGRCRRLRPCGHVYHADCIGLWLQRKWICPVCRAAVAMSRAEILDAVV